MTNEQALAHYRGVLEALRDLLPYAEYLAGDNYNAEVIANARTAVATATAADKLREGM